MKEYDIKSKTKKQENVFKKKFPYDSYEVFHQGHDDVSSDKNSK